MAGCCLGLAAQQQPADTAEAAPAPRLRPRQGDALAVEYLHDVAAQLQLRRLSNGALVRELALPGLGSVREFNGRREDSEAFFAYTDFVTPGSFYRCPRAGLLRACRRLLTNYVCSMQQGRYCYPSGACLLICARQPTTMLLSLPLL
jgi:hypothetical protein